MGFLSKFTDKIKEGDVIMLCNNFKRAYGSRDLKTMEKCVDDLQRSYPLNYLTNCATGIYIILAEANGTISPVKLSKLPAVVRNVEILQDQNVDSISNAEKELRKWYGQEFGRLLKQRESRFRF